MREGVAAFTLQPGPLESMQGRPLYTAQLHCDPNPKPNPNPNPNTNHCNMARHASWKKRSISGCDTTVAQMAAHTSGLAAGHLMRYPIARIAPSSAQKSTWSGLGLGLGLGVGLR